jgi:hypothetical protein
MPLGSIRPVPGLLGLGLLLILGAAIASADVEPNDERSSAEGIVAGTYDGSVNMTDRRDLYKMEVVGGDIIGLSFTTMSSGTQHLVVKDVQNVTVATLDSRSGARETVNVYISHELNMVWWCLVVSVGPAGSEAPGEYEFSLFYDLQDDGGTEGDAPSAFENALMLDAGEHTGEYGFHDTKDVYRVVVKAGWTLGLCLDCTEQAGPMKIQVFAEDDMITPRWSMDVMDEESSEWLLPAATPLGTKWYIVLEGVTDETYGQYTLDVDMIETDSGPPRIVKVTPKSFNPEEDLKVKVTIDEDTVIESATLYYRKDGKGSWKEVDLTLEGDAYTGKIRKGDLGGADEIQYYIEATDTTGFEGALGSETEVETMKSAGESPGFGLLLAAVAITCMGITGRWRRQ